MFLLVSAGWSLPERRCTYTLLIPNQGGTSPLKSIRVADVHVNFANLLDETLDFSSKTQTRLINFAEESRRNRSVFDVRILYLLT